MKPRRGPRWDEGPAMRRHGKGPREGIVRAWGSFAKALILKEIWTEEEKRMLEGLGEKGRAQ